MCVLSKYIQNIFRFSSLSCQRVVVCCCTNLYRTLKTVELFALFITFVRMHFIFQKNIYTNTRIIIVIRQLTSIANDSLHLLRFSFCLVWNRLCFACFAFCLVVTLVVYARFYLLTELLTDFCNIIHNVRNKVRKSYKNKFQHSHD